MENIFFGLITGSILLLAAVGFSMVRKIDGFLNIAHGQFMALGAYLTYQFYKIWDLPFILAAFIAIALCSGLGLASARFIYQPLQKRGSGALLFSSIGLAYVMYGLIFVLWEGGIVSLGFTPNPVMLGPLITTPIELYIIMTAVVSVIALHMFLTKTRQGTALRAMSSNFNLARVRGINSKRISNYVWIISSGLAGLAGVLIASKTSVNSALGWELNMLIIAATIVGGIGNLYGVMLGALIVGLTMDISTLILPAYYREAVAFLMVIIVLSVKPKGILGGS